MARKAAAAPKAEAPATDNIVHLGPGLGSNGGAEFIELGQPYVARIGITGSVDLLFHRWNDEAVEASAAAKKNSKAKKTDAVESYVWRNPEGDICLPGIYLQRSLVEAARFKQDPRSPRKSAYDLVNAVVQPKTMLASLGAKEWDYLHKARVRVQRNAISRTRPAMLAGWHCEIELDVLSGEYVDAAFLRELLAISGRTIGVGDFRPSHGRYDVTHFEIVAFE